MAQYATSAELAALGIPAAALSGFSGDPDDFLVAATARIDSYLRGRYQLPLTSPYPQEVVEATAILAAYSLLSVRGFDPENSADVNVRMRHEDVTKWLREIARGRASLDLEQDAVPSYSAGGPIVSSRTRNSSDRFRGLGGDDWSEDDC